MEILTEELLDKMAVLVIDMQEGFITEEKKKIVSGQLEIFNLVKKKNVPVIIIKLINEIDYGNIIKEISEASQNISSPNLYEITKEKDDAFEKTELADILRDREKDHLLVMGVNACECVFKTAAHALDEGYKVITGLGLIAGYCPKCSKEITDYWYGQKCIMI
jgi:nicotinamidase-related amidase